MKTETNQNQKQLVKKIEALTKNHKHASHYQDDTNPLFELAESRHFADSKKVPSDRPSTPRKRW
jgi:hypothetical protein